MGLFVKFSELQDYGVHRVFYLENANIDSSQRNVVFLVRGEKARHVRTVAGMSFFYLPLSACEAGACTFSWVVMGLYKITQIFPTLCDLEYFPISIHTLSILQAHFIRASFCTPTLSAIRMS